MTVIAPNAPQAASDLHEAAGTRQLLRFAMAGRAYALCIDEVREILDLTTATALTPLPLTPRFVRGVMNLRGAVVPVLDLGDRLGLDAAPAGRRACIVVVDAPGAHDGNAPPPFGLVIDAVHEVVACGSDDEEPVPPLGTHIDAGFIRRIVRMRGEATPELDLATILEHHALLELVSRQSGA